MISDITIGQYFPGNSIIHRLDARMKIVLTFLLIILIFLCKNFLSIAAAFVIIAAIVMMSKIPVKTILKSLKPLIFVVLLTVIFNLAYGQGEALVTIWRFSITLDGIKMACFIVFRILTLVTVSSILTYSTSPTQLTDAIESLMKPLGFFRVDVHTIAMTVTIALRFIPTLIEETDKIMAAQKSRGADMESGGLIHRIKGVVPILIPLFISSFRRARELAYAMMCRCYRGGEGRTKMKKMKLQKMDYIALLFTVMTGALFIALNNLMVAVI